MNCAVAEPVSYQSGDRKQLKKNWEVPRETCGECVCDRVYVDTPGQRAKNFHCSHLYPQKGTNQQKESSSGLKVPVDEVYLLYIRCKRHFDLEQANIQWAWPISSKS